MELEDRGLGNVDGWIREGRRSGDVRLVDEMDWPREWYGLSWGRLKFAGRAGTGGIEDAEEPRRRIAGGALGWLRLTLPAAAAVTV